MGGTFGFAGLTQPGATGIIQSSLDTTIGDSGGPLYLDNTGKGDWRVIGVNSTGGSSINSMTRFTTTVFNFLKANSVFPN